MTSATQQTRTRTLAAFWLLVAISLPIWMHFEAPGWDVGVYVNAIRSLRAGHDPYADAMAVQRAFHAQMAAQPKSEHVDPPWSYVYAPITLPLLRLIGSFSFWLSGAIYWIAYAASALAQIWVGMSATEPEERRVFVFLAPVAAFFPGFLANAIILGGNIAYILYAVVLLAAVVAWRRGNWVWFYAAVFAASCVKAPMLSLVVIPVLSARRQWIPATVTSVASLGVFALQPVLWPTLFRHYLEAVELQFSYNLDFGYSPAGLFGEFLSKRGLSYSPATSIFYLAYAIPLFAFLVLLSRHYLRGEFPLTRWMPVLLSGVILLNPRILEYDVAPISLLLALIAWRFFAVHLSRRATIVALAALFAAANAVAAIGWDVHKWVGGPLLIVFFAAGCYNLLHQSSAPARAPATQLNPESA